MKKLLASSLICATIVQLSVTANAEQSCAPKDLDTEAGVTANFQYGIVVRISFIKGLWVHLEFAFLQYMKNRYTFSLFGSNNQIVVLCRQENKLILLPMNLCLCLDSTSNMKFSFIKQDAGLWLIITLDSHEEVIELQNVSMQQISYLRFTNKGDNYIRANLCSLAEPGNTTIPKTLEHRATDGRCPRCAPESSKTIYGLAIALCIAVLALIGTSVYTWWLQKQRRMVKQVAAEETIGQAPPEVTRSIGTRKPILPPRKTNPSRSGETAAMENDVTYSIASKSFVTPVPSYIVETDHDAYLEPQEYNMTNGDSAEYDYYGFYDN